MCWAQRGFFLGFFMGTKTGFFCFCFKNLSIGKLPFKCHFVTLQILPFQTISLGGFFLAFILHLKLGVCWLERTCVLQMSGVQMHDFLAEASLCLLLFLKKNCSNMMHWHKMLKNGLVHLKPSETLENYFSSCVRDKLLTLWVPCLNPELGKEVHLSWEDSGLLQNEGIGGLVGQDALRLLCWLVTIHLMLYLP